MNINRTILSKIILRLVILPGIISSAISFNGCMKERMPSEPTPITRPLFNASSPANAQLIVPISTSIKLNFTEKMDLNTMPGRFIIQDPAGNPVSGTFSSNDTTVIFTPTQLLNKSSIYQIILKGRVRDIYENSIQYNNRDILDDTTIIVSNWFYTEGTYSENGFNHIFVRDRLKGNIYVFSYLDSLISTIPTFSAPLGMFTIPDGSYLLVSNTGKNELDFVNTQTNQNDKSISLPQNPSSIIVNGNYAYVVSDYGKAITKIDIINKSIANTFNLNFYPGKIAISTDGNTIFTFDQVTRDLVLINAANGTVLSRLKNAVTQIVSGNMVIDPSSQRLFICDTKGNKLNYTDMNGSSLSNAFTFPAGSGPNDISFDDKYLYVAAGNSIYKLDKQNFTLINQLNFSTGVKSLTIVPSKDIMYAVLSSSIAVIDLNSFFELKELDMNSSGLEGIISSPNKF